jgi:hypothetical protein
MKEPESDFHAWIGFVDMLVQMGFNDAIVVQAEPFADCILGDFQTAIQVAS